MNKDMCHSAEVEVIGGTKTTLESLHTHRPCCQSQ